MFKKHIFPNGLELLSFEAPGVSFEDVGFIVYAGSQNDPAGKEGLAHFVEHLVGNNCLLRPRQISDFFRQYGGSSNLGEVSDLTTSYGFEILAEQKSLRRAFSIFSSMLISSDLKNQEKQRRIVNNEIIRSRGSDEEHEIFEREGKMVFGWHPHFGKAIKGTGTPETFARISDQDVKEFYRRYYVPANMAIIAFGALTQEKLIEIISSTDFSAIRAGARNPAPSVKLIPEPPRENLFFGQGTKTGSSRAWDCYLSAALPGTINPLAISIFSRILDIILEKRLRNGRLGIYRASSGWSNLVDCHCFYVNVDAVPREKAEDVLRVLDDCFSEMTRNRSLFEKIKRWSIAALQIENNSGRTLIKNVLRDLRLFQEIKTLDNCLKDLQSVEFSDILEISRWLVKENRWVSFSKC
ncbi:MAG TPA: insulinase family protein [Candidatus Nanoarchaeia archaeon]|nr:insulinase family protein [Candidatus Nanoarchaeia archaeon]